MKIGALHILVGVGTVLTAVAVGVSTKLAVDKVNEVKQIRQQQDPEFEDLAGMEKFKIYARYEAIPLSMLIATCFGIFQCHKAAQETIKIAADVSAGATTFLNGYRDLTKEALGKKKEDELYSQAVQKVMPKKAPPNLIIGESDCLCMIISPGLDDSNNGIIFASTPTKIKEATLDFNNMFVRRVSKSMLNDASASFAEWLDYLGVKFDNRILDHLGWTYQHDGIVEISFRGGLTEDNKPILGIEFLHEPHYIE